MARGLVIAAPHSGSGKTVLTLALCRAFLDNGTRVVPAKAGPDYIDPAFLAAAAGEPAVNLDPWAMSRQRVRQLAEARARGADLLVVEGVMGLFDGATGGGGSTADLAAILGLPVVLVVDCRRMGQSVAALATGFAGHRDDIAIAGVVLNNTASDRHEAMLRTALDEVGIACLGAVPHAAALSLPDRHLGLVLPGAIGRFEEFVEAAAQAVRGALDLEAIGALARPLPEPEPAAPLPPLGQRVAIASDAAFSFTYEHWRTDWAEAGASWREFSPLADEPPASDADAVFLPGGYPELHAAELASAERFREGLVVARDRGALIYAECGGYMVLGKSLIDADGTTHAMAGLLPHASRFDSPRRTLGYRHLSHKSPLPFPAKLTGHEFHYATEEPGGAAPLFAMSDATGAQLPASGGIDGRVCGSWAHVVDRALEP